MPTVVLSQAAIDAGLPPGEYLDRALPNFYLRVQATRQSYGVRVYERGRRVRVPLGFAAGPAAIKLKDAHALAAAKFRQHADGKILRPPLVAAEALALGALDAETVTVKQLCEAFLSEHPNWSPSHKSNQAFMARRIVIPAWGSQLARTVTRLQVKTLTRAYALRAPVNANRLHAFLSKLFNWALNEESGHGEPLLDRNPMQKLPKPTHVDQRDRELTPAEIVTLWTALDAIEANPKSTPRALALAALWRLRLLTAQREQSLRRLEWRNVNLDDKVIEIPGAIMKGTKKDKRPHVVPLAPLALAIFQARRDAASPLDRFVFGTRVGTAKAPGRPRGVPVELVDFRGHDLRRTTYTLMTSHGISDFIADRVLGHKHKTVGGRVYNRYEYLAEKRVALELVDRLVAAVLDPANDASKTSVLAFVRA
jgi:integrase